MNRRCLTRALRLWMRRRIALPFRVDLVGYFALCVGLSQAACAKEREYANTKGAATAEPSDDEDVGDEPSTGPTDVDADDAGEPPAEDAPSRAADAGDAQAEPKDASADDPADTGTLAPDLRALLSELLDGYQRTAVWQCSCRVASDLYASTEECVRTTAPTLKLADCITDGIPESATGELRHWLQCMNAARRQTNACLETTSCADTAKCHDKSANCPMPSLTEFAHSVGTCPNAVVRAEGSTRP